MKRLFVMVAVMSAGLIWSTPKAAQVGFAVAKDENRSGIKWAWAMDDTQSRASQSARQMLKDEGYDNVSTQPCDEDCGFQLSSGYWVVIQSVYEIYDGSVKTGFGMGVSVHSEYEAKQRALNNLEKYNWSYSESKHQYRVIEKGQL